MRAAVAARPTFRFITPEKGSGMAELDVATAAPLLELCGIAKRYGGVRALEEVDFVVPAGLHPRRAG